MSAPWHLAQYNVARLKHAPEDPRVKGFFDEIDRINGLAERMPGYIWRFGDMGGANAPDPDDPRLTATLSVWESAEALERFVWKTLHRRVFARKAEWFEPPAGAYLVFWRVAPGTRPTMAEARAKLALLDARGETDAAFGWTRLRCATKPEAVA